MVCDGGRTSDDGNAPDDSDMSAVCGCDDPLDGDASADVRVSEGKASAGSAVSSAVRGDDDDGDGDNASGLVEPSDGEVGGNVCGVGEAPDPATSPDAGVGDVGVGDTGDTGDGDGVPAVCGGEATSVCVAEVSADDGDFDGSIAASLCK